MPTAIELTCPRCGTALPARADACVGCGLEVALEGGVVDVIGARAREDRAAGVEDFYSVSPFPGYGAGDDGPTLLDRSRRSAYLDGLDRSLAPDARVLDLGCGTGQTAAFLALASPAREVWGADGCRASLALADGFRERARIENLRLVRADLFDLPFEGGSFPTVVCRGVVHHTPEPWRAIEVAAALVAPGGTLVLGFYETRARLFHRARRGLSRVLGRPVGLFDPVLRRRDVDPEKKRIWIDDQYRHPLEHILPLPRVLACLESAGLRFVRTIPPAPRGESLFDAASEPSARGIAALRAGWALAGVTDPDAGLVCVVARRPAHEGLR
ncbi:MAG: class I SAM-dependent methyltransferase [Planctomycetota bacterium]